MWGFFFYRHIALLQRFTASKKLPKSELQAKVFKCQNGEKSVHMDVHMTKNRPNVHILRAHFVCKRHIQEAQFYVLWQP
jgi:hypothetical protein